MSVAHVEAAWRITGVEDGGRALTVVEKAVLVCHAWHANHVTGLSWVKKETVAVECCCTTRAVQSALAELCSRDLLHVHAYPNGGRGRSTEYQVQVFAHGRWTAPEKGEAPSPLRPAQDSCQPVKGEAGSENLRTENAPSAPACASAAGDCEAAAADSAVGPTYIEPATDSARARAYAPTRARPADAAPPHRQRPTTHNQPGMSSVGDVLRRAVPGLRVHPELDAMPMPTDDTATAPTGTTTHPAAETNGAPETSPSDERGA